MRGVAPAPAAVLAQLQSLRIVPLALVRLVVPALALLAGEGCSDPDVSTGHFALLAEVVVGIVPPRARKRTPPGAALSVAPPTPGSDTSHGRAGPDAADAIAAGKEQSSPMPRPTVARTCFG
jgi:hypothetical protein